MHCRICKYCLLTKCRFQKQVDYCTYTTYIYNMQIIHWDTIFVLAKFEKQKASSSSKNLISPKNLTFQAKRLCCSTLFHFLFLIKKFPRVVKSKLTINKLHNTLNTYIQYIKHFNKFKTFPFVSSLQKTIFGLFFLGYKFLSVRDL